MWFHGVGLATGYGWGVDAVWAGLRSGRSACRVEPGLQKALGADQVYAACVPDGGDVDDGPSLHNRAVRTSIRDAVRDARERGWRPGETVGIVHGAVFADMRAWRAIHRGEPLSRRGFCAAMPSTPLFEAMAEFDWHGPVLSVAATCASAGAALMTAASWLREGTVDDVIVVTADFSVTPEVLRGFRDLGVAVVDTPALMACRPFQQGSRGFLMGEAAVAFVANAQRATGSYGRLRGAAMTHDAHHVVSIEPSHQRLFQAARRALRNAGLAGADVGYLNAHGPGTAACDAAEAHLAEEVLGEQARVFSLKPLLGHCQSAAGGVEVAATLIGYDRHQLPAPVPVAAGHRQLLPGPTPYEPVPTMKTSLGMGGYNVALVLDNASPAARPSR